MVSLSHKGDYMTTADLHERLTPSVGRRRRLWGGKVEVDFSLKLSDQLAVTWVMSNATNGAHPMNPQNLTDQIEEKDGKTLLYYRGRFELRPGCTQIINTSKGLGPYCVARWTVVAVVTPFENGWTVLEVKANR
jgi:hypothetical protein